MKSWLPVLLTAYRNSPAPYPTVQSPTLYDSPFSHNTSVTDEQTNGQTTHRATDARQYTDVVRQKPQIFVVG